MYALILAGGSGTRLWPHSRTHLPKQFLPLTSQRTMLQETVDRILPLVNPGNVFIATGAKYLDLAAEQLPDIPRENILAEPSGRGTAPCIGWAALYIRQRDPNAVMAVLSADHRIHHVDTFRSVLQTGTQLAEAGHLVTIGIAPTVPATGYGYIQQGQPLDADVEYQPYRVARFVEKPSLDRAKAYLESGDYVWNAGMFVWRADRILQELAAYRPRLAAGLEHIGAAVGTDDEQTTLAEVWPQLDSVAIDVAVMEQTTHAVVIPADLGWSDIGDWAALAETLERDDKGNAVVGSHVGLSTNNTLVFGQKRVIATIGLENMIIIDTPDALLICPLDRAQDVKTLLDEVRTLDEALL